MVRILIPNVSSHVAIHQSGQGKRAHKSMTTPPHATLSIPAPQQTQHHDRGANHTTDQEGESDKRETAQLSCKSP